MMHTLVDGKLTVTKVKKRATKETIELTHAKTKSGKTTRKEREKVMEYELKFVAPEAPKSAPYTA